MYSSSPHKTLNKHEFIYYLDKFDEELIGLIWVWVYSLFTSTHDKKYFCSSYVRAFMLIYYRLCMNMVIKLEK